MKNIFIMGSRGFDKNYGGWETLVDNLIFNWKNTEYQFYVSELSDTKIDDGKFIHKKNVICPQIYVPKIGNFTMVWFSIKAILKTIAYIKKNKIENSIIYVLGVRIGPVFLILKNKLNKLNSKLIINPDGLEWTRKKWNWFVKRYFKFSESTMIKSSELIICDSIEIGKYIQKKYKRKSFYVSYGAYLNSKYNYSIDYTVDLMKKYSLIPNEYFLIVGRFVPENNYELIIKEYMKTTSKKKLIIVTNVVKNNFYKSLVKKTGFLNDNRVQIIGAVYDKKELRLIRKNAYAYIHGHSAGGTNPSLLESMATTKLNILFDVVFNREVGDNRGLYFNSESGNLKSLINQVELFDSNKIDYYGRMNKNIISSKYTWDKVVESTEKAFNEIYINFGVR